LRGVTDHHVVPGCRLLILIAAPFSSRLSRYSLPKPFEIVEESSPFAEQEAVLKAVRGLAWPGATVMMSFFMGGNLIWSNETAHLMDIREDEPAPAAGSGQLDRTHCSYQP
jgi:hypothetical protein